jgi:hypothetical protein
VYEAWNRPERSLAILPKLRLATPLGRSLATGVGAVFRPHLYDVVRTTQ